MLTISYFSPFSIKFGNQSLFHNCSIPDLVGGGYRLSLVLPSHQICGLTLLVSVISEETDLLVNFKSRAQNASPAPNTAQVPSPPPPGPILFHYTSTGSARFFANPSVSHTQSRSSPQLMGLWLLRLRRQQKRSFICGTFREKRSQSRAWLVSDDHITLADPKAADIGELRQQSPILIGRWKYESQGLRRTDGGNH